MTLGSALWVPILARAFHNVSCYAGWQAGRDLPLGVAARYGCPFILHKKIKIKLTQSSLHCREEAPRHDFP